MNFRKSTKNRIFAAAFIWAIIVEGTAYAVITAIKPDPNSSLTTFSPAVSSIPPQKVSTKSVHTITNFKGIGHKNGATDSGFDRKDGTPDKVDLNKRKHEGITLSPGMQRFADGAGRTLKQIDKKILDIVEEPFKWLGLEAESAKIRPMHGGVGLGVSINLDKGRKGVKRDAPSSKSDSQEFYDLIKPKESSHTVTN